MENDNGYPNLMCFGRDLNNCPYLESCVDSDECRKAYYQRYFSFMESNDSENE